MTGVYSLLWRCCVIPITQHGSSLARHRYSIIPSTVSLWVTHMLMKVTPRSSWSPSLCPHNTPCRSTGTCCMGLTRPHKPPYAPHPPPNTSHSTASLKNRPGSEALAKWEEWTHNPVVHPGLVENTLNTHYHSSASSYGPLKTALFT